MTPRGPFSTLQPMTMLLLRRADVFTPESLGLHHLLIGDGKILWMRSEAPALPAGLPVVTVDLDGRRLIPGLIDTHAHVTGGGGEAGVATRVPPVALSQEVAGGKRQRRGMFEPTTFESSPFETQESH